MKSTMLLNAVAVSVLVAAVEAPLAVAQHSGHEMPSVPSPAAPVARTGKAQGRILELSNTSITLETQRKGRAEKVTYLMGGETKRKGDLGVGADVVVRYREERGNNIATSVEAKKQKRPRT